MTTLTFYLLNQARVRAEVVTRGDQLTDDREAAELQETQDWLTSHTGEYPLELWIARRNEYLRQVAEVCTAENRLRLELDGSDTDMSAQLDDAGFGSQGPM